MKEINSIHNYIELQLEEANNKLDIEWEEGKAQARQELAGLSSDQMFTALLNNHKIVEAQRKRVDRLLQVILKNILQNMYL